ncbi:hypothetical protein L9F63_005920, partial [Diploptera punctata]
MYSTGFRKQQTQSTEADEEGNLTSDLFTEDKTGAEDEDLFKIDVEGQHSILDSDTSEDEQEEDNVSQINNLFRIDTFGKKIKDDNRDEDGLIDDDDDEEEEDIDDIDDESHNIRDFPAPKFPITINKEDSERSSSCSRTPESKKNAISWDNTYLDIQLDKIKGSELNKDARKFCNVDEIMKKSVITPGYEKMEKVPAYSEGMRALRKKRKEERERTKGSKWYDMPATEMTDEIKHDLEVIQMRSVLDPKHFYKKNELKVLPKYFQVGKVVDNAADFYHSRIPKKQRKRTIVDELLADAEFQRYNKKRYTEIIEERRKTHYKAHARAKKLK